MSNKPTILYLDDEDVNLFIFKSNFDDKFEVITTNSPADALEKIDSKTKIGAVISDMRMPGMNGVEFITKAKEAHPEIPYYILTAFDDNEEINNAVNNGLIKQCFKKPFDKDQIETSIALT